MAYYSAMQAIGPGDEHIEVRTHGDARLMLPAMRKAIAVMYPTVALEHPMTRRRNLINRMSDSACSPHWVDSLACWRHCWWPQGLYGTTRFGSIVVKPKSGYAYHWGQPHPRLGDVDA
jgi:hypothetical protein